MKQLTSIVAMNHDRAIGAGNELPWKLRSDLQFFKTTTVGNVVIMGRLTYDSLGKKPLPNRMNIVLSRSFDFLAPSEICKDALSIEEGLWTADSYCKKAVEAFVIGGASMYEQFAPFVDRYLITMVDKHVPHADTFIAEGLFSDPNDWSIDVIATKQANQNDEANFTILECLARDPKVFFDRRMDAINRAKGMACAKPRQTQSRQRRGDSFLRAAVPALF